MDKLDSNGSSRRMVVTELSHIKELVKQLEEQLGGSHELCRHLASQIFSLTERSIGIITSSDFNGSWKRSAAGLPAATPSSPGELADVPFRTTKRKVMEKRKNQVRVSSAGGGDPPVDDGHSWRKYGQKEILGAKHPRAYYRCTHRNSQGCAATKQVQRTDEDPAIFDVFYLGTHTCRVHKTVQQDKAAAAATQPTDAHSHLQNLTAKTEGLAMAGEPQGWKNATTPASVCLAPERSPFSAPSTLDNWGVSPATSDSNHDASFPAFDAAEWRAESELQEVVSALVFASTPPVTSMGITDEFPDIDISSFFA